MNSPLVAVAIGSNLGDRESHLQFARDRLSLLLNDTRFSSVYETDPVGAPNPQRKFLNQAAVGTTTSSSAPDFLAALLALELERGRARPFRNAPRTLDLDLILFGDLVSDRPELMLPHPRFRERLFVLEPLAEIAPGIKDPVSGRSVAQLLASFSNSEFLIPNS